MDIIISNKTVNTSLMKPFTSEYNYIFLSVDEDFADNNFKINEKNVSKVFEAINFSWDGEIFWFDNKDKSNVLTSLTDWFKQEKNHTEIDDNGIGNCFLIKDTPNGLCLIDTQYDMSSNIDSFLNTLSKKIKYKSYSDSHLIDHLYLGRDSIHDEFEEMYFLYKEKIIDSSFFFKGLSVMEDKPYLDILPKEKNIVMTGKFPGARQDIIDSLLELEYSSSNTLTKNSWLWMGDGVGKNKVIKAQQDGTQCSTIDEVIDLAFNNYLKNKPKKSIKIKT